MQLRTYTVTYEAAYYRKTVRFHIRLHRMPDVGDPTPLLCEFQTLKKTLFGDINGASWACGEISPQA